MTAKAATDIKLRDILLWKRKLSDVQFANLPSGSTRPNPLVCKDRLYSQIFNPNSVIALDRQSGKVLWRTFLEGFGSDTLVVNNGRIYTRTTLEQVCLDALSGNILWRYMPDGAGGEMFYAIPHIHDGKLFTGDTKGYFHCLNAKTGELIWKRLVSTRRRMINGNPMVASGLVIVGTNLHYAVAFHANTGEIAWRQRLDENCASDTILAGSEVVLSSWETLYRLRITDGAIMLRWRQNGWRIQNFTMVGGRIILLTKRDVTSANEAEAKEDYYNPSQKIICLENGASIWDMEAPLFSNTLRYHKQSKLLCVGNFNRFYFLSPVSGVTQHVVAVERSISGSGELSNPDCIDGVFYWQNSRGLIMAARVPGSEHLAKD